jgi:hypothetical protein
MAELLEPQEIAVPLPDGTTKQYVISKFPAIAGREIVCKYPLSGMPKLGDYAVNEETMLKLMAYVAVPTDNGPLRLNTRALVDNHIASWETLAKLEVAMLEYNCSFFGNGRASTFLDGIAQKAQVSISKILMGLLAQLSQKGGQPSKS